MNARQAPRRAEAGPTVRRAEELRALAGTPLVQSLAPEPPLILALESLAPQESADWESRLNREWTACACAPGELAAALVSLTYALMAVIGAAPSASSVWVHLARGLVLAVLAAAVGKVVGRSRSLHRFRLVARELEALDGSRRVRSRAGPGQRAQG